MNNGRIIAAFLFAFVASGAVRAAADPAANRCGGSKTKAVARYAKSDFACDASALERGEAIDPECTARAATKLDSGFDKAELAGGCVTTDDQSAAAFVVDDARAAIDSLLAPDPTDEARACASTKLKAAGRYLNGRLGCYGKSAVRSLAPSDACFAKAYERLVSAFSSAETAGGCTTTNELASVVTIDDDATRELVRALSPVCGDTIQGPSQECDAGDDAARRNDVERSRAEENQERRTFKQWCLWREHLRSRARVRHPLP